MSPHESEVEHQRSYYAATAQAYEAAHVQEDDEHFFALAWLAGLVQHYRVESVLDVGCGTGRALRYLKPRFPQARLTGVEPAPELRAVGHRAGLTAAELIAGDATRLEFPDESFDIVCEFGALHHIREPRKAISEMMRVARLGIFISDDNHLAAGSRANRWVKRTLNALGVWNVAYRLRTGGKGFRVSAGDGLSYPYSVFDDLAYIRQRCDRVHMINAKGTGPDLLAGAPNVALFAKIAR
jgi:SAM-dependent methyltransferase